jgi:hypothetical protein
MEQGTALVTNISLTQHENNHRTVQIRTKHGAPEPQLLIKMTEQLTFPTSSLLHSNFLHITNKR